MLDAEPRDAIDIVFTALGATNGAASALDDVVASALGAKPTRRPRSAAAPVRRVGPTRPNRRRAHARTRDRARRDRDRVARRHATTRSPYPSGRRQPGARRRPRRRPPHGARHGTPRRSTPERVGSGSRARPARARAPDRSVRAARCSTSPARTRRRTRAVRSPDRALPGRTPPAGRRARRDRGARRDTGRGRRRARIRSTAALAKATAGRTARTVAAHCQQVLAGIGFTTDHPFHRFLKRTMLLDGILGSADEIVVDIGRQLLATRDRPDPHRALTWEL